MDGGNSQGPHGSRGFPQLAGQVHGRRRQLPDQVGGGGELHLTGAVMELGIPHRHLDAAGIQPAVPQSGGHGVRQHGDAAPHLLCGGEVFREGSAVAYGLHHLRLVPGADWIGVQPVGIVVELDAHFAHQGLQGIPLAGRQLSDGLHAELGQNLPGGAPHVQQRPHRQRPDQPLPVLPGDDSGGVGFPVVAAQLGKHLVEGDPH